MFQLALTAEKSWRKLGGFKAVADQPDETEDDQQKIAA